MKLITLVFPKLFSLNQNSCFSFIRSSLFDQGPHNKNVVIIIPLLHQAWGAFQLHWGDIKQLIYCPHKTRFYLLWDVGTPNDADVGCTGGGFPTWCTVAAPPLSWVVGPGLRWTSPLSRSKTIKMFCRRPLVFTF